MAVCWLVTKRKIQALFTLCFVLSVVVIVAIYLSSRVKIVKQLVLDNQVKLYASVEAANITKEISRTIHEVEKTPLQDEIPSKESECIPWERIADKDEETLITGKEYNVAFKLAGVKDGSFIMKRFRNFVISICNHSSVSLVFHLFMDSHAIEITRKVFDEARKVCKCLFKMKSYDINYLLSTQKGTIQAVMSATQDSLGMGRKHLFFLPIILHRFLPSFLDRMILFDSDFYFQSDIKQLFAHFDNFTDENCFGGVYVQQPTYRYACRKYRASHPDTKLGSPPPDGVPGYNGGLIMMHLKNLRKSKLYNIILTENRVKQYAEKYQFRNSLGEQDFFIMLDMEHHELFYVLPCSWNRQTTYYLGDRSYVSVYDLYHNCSEPIHAYHGNARAKMPNER